MTIGEFKQIQKQIKEFTLQDFKDWGESWATEMDAVNMTDDRQFEEVVGGSEHLVGQDQHRTTD